MKFSAKTRYAVRILSELAAASVPLSIGDVSEKTGISPRTVEHICARLRHDGISTGIVGSGGGIRLKVPLGNISLGRLIDLFEDGVQFAVCCGDKANDCPNQHVCENRAIWRKLSAKIQAELDAIPLGSLLLR
ncbi:MAG: Rrf2 family transcriptional regulator [Deltaproteobacteria bacterium]|jgi:Rrf2 family protein|nr:Rrf2 family transcriptional regulator [Deltaproteobacteria bacterium]